MANDGGHAGTEGVDHNVNDAGNNSSPGNGTAYPANIKNTYFNHAVWSLQPQPGYAYPNIPPPTTTMNMNTDAYFFNENDGSYYYYHPPTDDFYPVQPQPQLIHLQPQPQPEPVLDALQPQPQLIHPQPQPQPQPQPEPVLDAGRRANSGCRHSSGRNSNTLQEAGRGTGRVLRDNNCNKNTALPEVMGNIGELLMRMRINEDEHANADVASREYSNAKFFVIKSYSRDNVVSSIKHSVWTSTHRGNRILNAAYREARDEHSVNAIFLFFSVAGSRNFCGVAEMDGPVDFEASADCWDRDWKGKFPVKWHITKDVPYSEFMHIPFNTAENPNQTQQVEFEKGVEMLKK